MKYIFSRKGFDSTAGGYPSLIFPDGALFSIPIPAAQEKQTYRDLDYQYEGDSIQKILNDVTGKSIRTDRLRDCDYADKLQSCHYDPILLNKGDSPLMTLGQAHAAEGHLRKQKVGKGDVFLFYGWFRKVEKNAGVWAYVENAPDVHLIWSYMKIDESLCLDTNAQQDNALKKYPFIIKHPHVGDQNGSNNRIYISDAYQYFSFSAARCLTDMKNYKGRSTWRLPACLHQPDAFSFLNKFTLDGKDTLVSYRGYGQEFVLDVDKVKSGRWLLWA